MSLRGRDQARRAARLLGAQRFHPTIVYTSMLARAVRTCDIVQHTLGAPVAPRRVEWRLMERNYGALTGRLRTEVFAEYGRDRFHAWRRGLNETPPPLDARSLACVRAQPGLANVPPPAVAGAESLADVIRRVGDVWRDGMADGLRDGQDVLVVAHGNSLRALCAVIDGLSADEIAELNIPTGEPLLYTFDGEFTPAIRGGHYLDARRARDAAAVLSALGGT